MNKYEMVGAIATRLDVSRAEAAPMLEAVLEEIMHQVSNGTRVTLVGFGTFERRIRPERNATNPKTQEPIHVEEKPYARFKPGKVFREAVES